MSRAIGDFVYKIAQSKRPEEQMVIATPEVRTVRLRPGDEFALLATDGVWDMVSNQARAGAPPAAADGGFSPAFSSLLSLLPARRLARLPLLGGVEGPHCCAAGAGGRPF